MGRTHRFDPEVGNSRARKPRRQKEKINGVPIEYLVIPENPAATEPFESAIAKLGKHIKHKLDMMEESGLTRPSEREFFHDFIVDHLKPVYRKFDPNHVGKDGEVCSLNRYLKMATETIILNIAQSRERACNKAQLVTITGENPNEAREHGCISSEDLSDECRSVKELEFRMDVATLRSMLTATERRVLDMRCEGYTNEEIGGEFGRDRNWVEKTVLKRIQAVARECGFVPQSEVRVMERSVKAA